MTYFPEADPVLRTEMTLEVGQGVGAATYLYQAFNILGTIQIEGLYATLTDATAADTLHDLAWDIGKASDSTGGTFLTKGVDEGATGADMDDFEIGSWIGKCNDATNLAEVLDASAFGLNEKPLEGCILMVDGGEVSATTIGFQVTEDADTEVEFRMVVLWKPRSPGASVTPGSGHIRGAE
jgi:hypothetical protein